jgi:uncharacterized OB-fold protein
MSNAYDRPLPLPSNETLTKPFWNATKEGRLIIPRCNTCSRMFFYPREVCPQCFSTDLGWQEVSGKGRVYSYTHVRQASHPYFQSANGHIYAIIQLNEGIKMPSNIIECDPNDVEIDMEVEAVFEKVSDEYSLVKFQPFK